MKQIAVRVDDDLLAAIEAARGDLPRERWMRAALRAFATGAHGHPVTQGMGSTPKVAPVTPAAAPTAAAARLVEDRNAHALAMARQRKLNDAKYGKR